MLEGQGAASGLAMTDDLQDKGDQRQDEHNDVVNFHLPLLCLVWPCPLHGLV